MRDNLEFDLPSPRPALPLPRRWLLSIVAVILMASVVSVVVLVTRLKPGPSAPPWVRQEIIAEVHLTDWPSGPSYLSFFEANEEWLETPLWADKPFDVYSSCAGFTNYITCWAPSNAGTGWDILPLLLGTVALQQAGLPPDTNAQPAPIVAAYLNALQARGINTWFWLGNIQSAPICSQGRCFQFFQRQRLEWPQNSQNPQDVRLSPLGQALTKSKGSWGR